MTQAVPINELDTTPKIYFNGGGSAVSVRTYILYRDTGNQAFGRLGWDDYTINSRRDYYRSHYDPYKEQTKQNLASDIELEALLSSEPSSVPIKKVLGQNLASVAKMLQKRDIEASYVFTDGNILDELVNMVEGGINTFGIKGFLAQYLPKTFSRWVGLRHGYKAQLLGIELMAQLEMPHAEKALQYLTHLFEPTVTKNEVLYVYPDPYTEWAIGDKVFYPNAQGGLKKKLGYALPSKRYFGGGGSYPVIIPDDQIEAELEEIMSTPPHSTISNSIERLRITALGPQVRRTVVESQVRRTINALERLL